MKHYIFCCSNDYPDKIEMAIKTKNILALQWMLEHDCILQSYHSTFNVIKSDYNTEITLENDNVSQLIDDAMSFARYLEYMNNNFEVTNC